MPPIPLFDATPYLQVLIALALGALIGIERSVAHKRAGMRTYGFVAMGSCLFIVLTNMSLALYPQAGVNPFVIAAAIITGIGFVAAGHIIVRGSDIMGLTTATGLWVATGIGMAVGLQFYGLATFVTLLTLIVFRIFVALENRVVGDHMGNGNGNGSGPHIA